MATGTRLKIGAVVVSFVILHMAYVGGTSSWQYYMTVDECVDQMGSLIDRPIRLSGKIAIDSLHVSVDHARAAFVLAGEGQEIEVRCRGPFPDDLREERHVVVEGRVESDGTFTGDKLLTRCASKYTSEGSQATGGQGQEFNGPRREG